MSSYFDRFMQQTRIKVDRDAADRWKYDAAREGEKNIKAQMATARRTATTLQNSIKNFSNLKPEQELAIKAAASAMRSLADEMQSLAVWARAYKIFVEEEYKKERAADLESIAAQRWGDDHEALSFEVALIEEIHSKAGRLAFARWLHSRGDCTNFAVERIYDPFSGGTHESFALTARTRAAMMIEDGRRSSSRHTSFTGNDLHASWSDYEGYLAYRKEVAKTTARVMQMGCQP